VQSGLIFRRVSVSGRNSHGKNSLLGSCRRRIVGGLGRFPGGHHSPADTSTIERGASDLHIKAGDVFRARINGKLVTIGSHSLFDAEHPHEHDLCEMVDAAEAGGQTTMLLSDGDRVRGFIALADKLRPESYTVVRQLHSLDIQTVMLTGDNATVDKTAIDWLRVTVTTTEGGPRGVLARTTFIQRVNTTGGLAPDTGCSSAADVGKSAFVPYTADYNFYDDRTDYR